MAEAYILAGEPSGDVLASALMRALATDYQGWHGIGGPLMKDAGLVSKHDFQKLHILGLSEAIRHYASLKKLLHQMIDEVCQLRPDIIFTVDTKAFSLRFAKELKKKMAQIGWSVPIIHMVAPTIWAYGAGRKAAFEDAFDGMLCLFPMEMGLFDAKKLNTAFIGHPAAYRPVISRPVVTPSQDHPLSVLLLPGSRRSEVSRLLPKFLQACEMIAKQQNITVIIPTIENVADDIKNLSKNSGIEITIDVKKTAVQDAFSSCDVMIAASGTVTLEAALAAMPGITAYQLSPMIAAVMRWRFQLNDPILPNIILNDRVYPFFFQKHVTAQNLANAILKQSEDADTTQAKLTKQAEALRRALTTDDDSFEAAIQRAVNSLF